VQPNDGLKRNETRLGEPEGETMAFKTINLAERKNATRFGRLPYALLR
jgi:hypothetical protein